MREVARIRRHRELMRYAEREAIAGDRRIKVSRVALHAFSRAAFTLKSLHVSDRRR